MASFKIPIMTEPPSEVVFATAEREYKVPTDILNREYNALREGKLELAQFGLNCGLVNPDGSGMTDGELVQVINRYAEALPELNELTKKFDAAMEEIANSTGKTSSQADSSQQTTTS